MLVGFTGDWKLSVIRLTNKNLEIADGGCCISLLVKRAMIDVCRVLQRVPR
jgi:hypothetical protein